MHASAAAGGVAAGGARKAATGSVVALSRRARTRV